MKSDDNEEPERRLADDDLAHRHVGRCAHDVSEEEDFSPEEADGGPAGEAVRALEGVVPREAEARVGEDNDQNKENEQDIGNRKGGH